MPSGNVDNLKGYGFHERSAEEVREMQSRGGKHSVETRRKKKQIKEYLEILLERDAGKDSSGKTITTAEAMAIKAIKEAMNGDWKAWELVRDTAGQKPVEKVMVSDITPETIEEVEAIINGIE